MKKVVSIVLIVLVVLLALGAVATVVVPLVTRAPLAYGRGFVRPYMPVGFGLVGSLVTFLFFLLIVLAVISLAQPTERGLAKEALPPSESPVEILKRRYAQGEITKEQYEEMKREIGS